MTREQKAAAAIGSVLAVSLLYMAAWSFWAGWLLLVAGLTVCIVALRLTHPRARRRQPLGAQDRRARDAEMARRREEAQRRALERSRAGQEHWRRAQQRRAVGDDVQAPLTDHE
jgi:thiosulfate reductase cytochrome b subunit